VLELRLSRPPAAEKLGGMLAAVMAATGE